MKRITPDHVLAVLQALRYGPEFYPHRDMLRKAIKSEINVNRTLALIIAAMNALVLVSAFAIDNRNNMAVGFCIASMVANTSYTVFLVNHALTAKHEMVVLNWVVYVYETSLGIKESKAND